MYGFVLGLFLVVAVALILVILMQQGKGAVMGASFGSGASNTVFGASGSAGFLTRATTFLAIAFFALALLIGALTAGRGKSESGDDVFAADQKAAVENASDGNMLPPTGDLSVEGANAEVPAEVALPPTSSTPEMPATSEAVSTESSAAVEAPAPAAESTEVAKEEVTTEEQAPSAAPEQEQETK